MRLIDADALLEKQESLYMMGNVLFHWMTAYSIENAPTIDPETLPIVRELREKLEQVTAERDAAIADLKILSDCDYCKYDCKNYEEDDCRFCSVKKCKCKTCKDGSSWEWRGPIAENGSEVQASDRP